MSRLTGWWYSVSALLRRNEADRDMADEIAFHIDRQTRKHEERGLSHEDARRLALREFGGTTRWREEARRARGSSMIDIVEQDLRQTVRALRRDTGFTGLAIATLALAIGANAAMFGIIDRVLLRGPEHVAAPAQLMRVYVTRVAPSSNVVTSARQPYVLYTNVRDHASAFSMVASYVSAQLRVGSGTEARFVPVIYATPDLFALTGVRPALGRFYSAEEDQPPVAQQVVVIGYGYWQRELGGDSAIVGKVVSFADRDFRVIGVAPRGYTGVERGPVDAWLPMSNLTFSYNTLPNWPTNWRGGLASVVGRLAVARPVAEAQLTAMLRRVYTGNDPAMRRADVSLRPVSYNMDGVEPPEIGVARLLGGVGLVMLLVAAANVTNLGLARAIRRRRELSVRVALGAGRWRIVRLMVVESVAIALVAGALGLVIAHWGGQIIRRALLPNVAWSELPVDGRVLVWTAALTLITGVIVGLVPALRVSKGDVAAALRGGRAGAGSAGESHGAVRAALQVVQLALSLVLLFATGLFVRSLVDIQQLDLGYDRDRVLSIDIAFPQRDSATKEDLARDVAAAEERYTDLRTRFEHLPGVAGASVAFGNPLSAVIILSIRAPGIDSLDPTRGGRPLVTAAAPGYFATVGTRILRGRPFAAGEGSGSEPVVIVNQTMAQSIWPNEDALGRCIVFGTAQSPCARVIGIAQDVHQMSLKEPALSQCYIPWGQDRRFIPGSDLLVRARDDAKALIPSIKEVLRRGAQGMQSAEIRTLEEKLDPQVRPWRVGATLFGLFGMTVVVVAVVGLFSVVSYLVTQRTHEIGIRIALGARRGHVLRLVMGNGLRTAAIGILVGGTLSTALAPLLQPLLFDNRARDPLLLGGIGVGLIIVAAAASFWPSWRATRLDPLLALRAD